MATVFTNDELRIVTVEREVVEGREHVYLQITSEKLIPAFQILMFSAEAWDELVAGAK